MPLCKDSVYSVFFWNVTEQSIFGNDYGVTKIGFGIDIAGSAIFGMVQTKKIIGITLKKE